MKLGFKYSLFLVIPLVTLTAAGGFWFWRQSRTMLREELIREGRAIALVVQIAAEDYLRDRQVADLRQLVDGVTGYERVLGLRLFDQDGNLTYQSAALDAYPFLHHDLLRRVLSEGTPGQMQRRIGEQSVIGFVVPLRDSHHEMIGAVQVLQLESFMEEDDHVNRRFIFGLSLALALATIGIVLVVTRFSVTRPIEALVKSFREVGAHDRPSPIPVRSEDELGRLAREFNGMCERLEVANLSLFAEQEHRRQVEAELRKTERLAGLGRLAAGLAHEIGTPLNVISGRATALARTLEGQEETERNLKIITSQIDRITRTVRDMLDFARMKPPQRVRTDVTDVLTSVFDLMESQLERRGIHLQIDHDGPVPPLDADPDQLQQVFLNIVVNAMDAMETGGTLKVQTAVQTAKRPDQEVLPERCVVVTFWDTGIGIQPEHRDQVFDPFFTTKEVGRGTGLGLSVSYGIVRDHGGWLELDSEAGRGTRVSIFLPCDDGGPGHRGIAP